MSKEDRKTLLELSTYQHIFLRVRSGRALGGSNHVVSKAERVSFKRGLQQIKEQSIQCKTKYKPNILQ